MNIHLSDHAPTELPRIHYATVDDDQAAHISEAMTLEENQAKFDVSFIPIDTAEARHAAAEEWYAYKQALGAVAAKERGAYALINTRNESPEAIEKFLERQIPIPDFAAHALLKVTLKSKKAKIHNLMRSFYESETTQTNR